MSKKKISLPNQKKKKNPSPKQAHIDVSTWSPRAQLKQGLSHFGARSFCITNHAISSPNDSTTTNKYHYTVVEEE